MKAKTFRISNELCTDTIHVFHLKSNTLFDVIAKNVRFRIKTNRFGLAYYCLDANKVKITHEKNWRKTYYKLCIITNNCFQASSYSFNAFMQKKIKDFFLSEIKSAVTVMRTADIINADQSITASKSPVNTLAKVNSKKKVGKMRFRSFVSAIALEFVKTMSRFNDLLNNREFSYKEFLTIYSKKFNEIYSLLT